jgi:predicted transcriptional regulator of viral defense system
MTAAQYIDHLASQGRYNFTTAESAEVLGVSQVAARAALRRLMRKGEIAVPYRGFHVIVPPEYRQIGCLPGEQLIDQFMEHLSEPYYVSLLSAAEYYGAAHHRPQQLQVVAEKNRPALDCGRVQIAFIARSNARDIPIRLFNTPRGTLRVSTPEATAFDLVGYPEHCAGLDNVVTVLSELAESLDPDLLAEAAGLSPLPWSQRLGYLLEYLGANDAASHLAAFVADKAPHVTPLAPAAPMRGTPRDLRWKVAINTTVEAEL